MAAVKSLPLPVEDLLIGVCYHFHHSAKQKEQYKEFMDFLVVEPSKSSESSGTPSPSLASPEIVFFVSGGCRATRTCEEMCRSCV